MKHKIHILIPVFVLLVLIYGVRSALGTHVQVETLRRGSMEDMVSAKGVVIKYENVLNPGVTGMFEALAREGSRVAVGQEIAVIYAGSVDTELKNRLEQVNKKITQIEKNQANLFSFSSDVTRLEQKIAEQTDELIQKSRSGDFSAVGEIRFVIGALCEKKAQISGGTAGNNVIDELRRQKTQLENQIGAARHKIKAPAAGVFCVSVDGLEQVVTPYTMTDLTPSAVDQLLERDKGQEAKGEDTCKIIQNFRYFIAVNLPADKLGTLRTDDSVGLRFYDLSGELINARILYISPQEEGRNTVVLEVDQYLESLLKRRFVNLEFVKQRYEGYRVNVKSLRTKDNVNGVYVRRDEVLKFIPVTILYNTQDVAIINSADENMPLRLYDEVVVSASSYEEGKLLR